MNNDIDKEKERRKKISLKLKEYFETPKGLEHRNKLREQQKTKMNNLYKNKDIKS